MGVKPHPTPSPHRAPHGSVPPTLPIRTHTRTPRGPNAPESAPYLGAGGEAEASGTVTGSVTDSDS